MCIVVVKPMGVSFPKRNWIENCVKNNPSGFSMAWNVKNKKGTMGLLNYQTLDKDEFLKFFDNLTTYLDPKTTAMIFHCRIKTEGSVCIKNCHCWKSEDFAFAHNGSLGIKVHDDMTDSECFFRDIFTPIYKYGGWDAATKVINELIDKSKFAFLDKEGVVKTFGDFSTEEGCMFSNKSYQDTYTKVTYTKYSSYDDYEDYYFK